MYVDSESPNAVSFGAGNENKVYLGKLQAARRVLRQRTGSEPSIDAVEITWSGLTYRVKSAQLIYDLTEQGRKRFIADTQAPRPHPSQGRRTSRVTAQIPTVRIAFGPPRTRW
jgi:hypothetical protein